MPKKIDVYGLADAEIEALREIALKKYGKASVSLLAKKLLQEQLNDSEPCTDGDKHPAVTTKKNTNGTEVAHIHTRISRPHRYRATNDT